MRPRDLKKNKKKKDMFVPKKVRITKQVKKRMKQPPPGERFGKKWFPYHD